LLYINEKVITTPRHRRAHNHILVSVHAKEEGTLHLHRMYVVT